VGKAAIENLRRIDEKINESDPLIHCAPVESEQWRSSNVLLCC